MTTTAKLILIITVTLILTGCNSEQSQKHFAPEKTLIQSNLQSQRSTAQRSTAKSSTAQRSKLNRLNRLIAEKKDIIEMWTFIIEDSEKTLKHQLKTRPKTQS